MKREILNTLFIIYSLEKFTIDSINCISNHGMFNNYHLKVELWSWNESSKLIDLSYKLSKNNKYNNNFFRNFFFSRFFFFLFLIILFTRSPINGDELIVYEKIEKILKEAAG
ncbi:hypothetical protein ACKWTF_003699 [Chironomus riparius]